MDLELTVLVRDTGLIHKNITKYINSVDKSEVTSENIKKVIADTIMHSWEMKDEDTVIIKI